MARGEQGLGAMTRERMAAILEAYGAAAARWPHNERAAALAWASDHAAEFAELACEATVLDTLLAFDRRDSDGDAALMARILAAVPANEGGGDILRPVFGRRGAAQGIWREVAALAACAVLGLAIGLSRTPRDDAGHEMDAAFAAAFQMPGADLDDGAGG